MDIKENIEKQIQAGFSREEIYSNLISKGYSQLDIDKEISAVSITMEKATEESGVSTKNILLGLLVVIIVLVRIQRYASTGTTLAFITILTGIGMAIYFFTKRK